MKLHFFLIFTLYLIGIAIPWFGLACCFWSYPLAFLIVGMIVFSVTVILNITAVIIGYKEGKKTNVYSFWFKASSFLLFLSVVAISVYLIGII